MSNGFTPTAVLSEQNRPILRKALLQKNKTKVMKFSISTGNTEYRIYCTGCQKKVYSFSLVQPQEAQAVNFNEQ